MPFGSTMKHIPHKGIKKWCICGHSKDEHSGIGCYHGTCFCAGFIELIGAEYGE